MTCTDCGKDVAEADTPSGMSCCVSCRLKQIEAMPAVQAAVRLLAARIVETNHDMDRFVATRPIGRKRDE